MIRFHETFRGSSTFDTTPTYPKGKVRLSGGHAKVAILAAVDAPGKEAQRREHRTPIIGCFGPCAPRRAPRNDNGPIAEAVGPFYCQRAMRAAHTSRPAVAAMHRGSTRTAQSILNPLPDNTLA